MIETILTYRQNRPRMEYTFTVVFVYSSASLNYAVEHWKNFYHPNPSPPHENERTDIVLEQG